MYSTKKIIALFLSLFMFVSVMSPASSILINAQNNADIVASLPMVAISDIHYYPPSFTDNNNAAWQEYASNSTKEYAESQPLLLTALDSIELMAEEKGYKYLIIPGDLTKDSEYEAHTELASILENFEKNTGIEVFVINGNHDINVQDACTFENGKKESARSITQDEFREVYASLGYDHAVSEYSPTDGSSQGGLSYAADLDENYRLIVVDSSKYNPDTPSKAQTGGMMTEDAMNWVKQMASEAYESGRTPVFMTHHSIAPHMKIEPSVTHAFCIDDYEWVAENLADAGIHFAFTGHLHTNDIACVVSDNGNVIYDCEVGALTGYPNVIRDILFETDSDGETYFTSDVFDIDTAHPVTIGEKTYPKPFSTQSFAINYGGRSSDDGYADAVEFFMGIIKTYVFRYIDDIKAAGGINSFLKTMDIDLEQLLKDLISPYIGDGIRLGNVSVLSVDNIMFFIEDLMSQVEELYINNPDNLENLIEDIVTKVIDLEIADIPCTKFIDTYHFGNEETNGTLGDFILSVMVYWFSGNEDCSDDLFILDVIKNFESGKNTQLIIDTLIDIILNDVAYDGILSKLYIRFEKLVDSDAHYSDILGCSIKDFTNKILCGDTSYLGLINTVFGLGILPYASVEEIIFSLYDSYITESQIESLSANIIYYIEDFTTDTNPQQNGDYGVTYSSHSIEPEVSQYNYRLPSMINVTLGADSTSANISWFTKSTVPGCDIEIYKAEDFNGFTGIPTKSEDVDFNLNVTSEKVTVSYPGIDIGIIGFFYYEFELNHSVATLTGLEKDTEYIYRVGDSERGWWSQEGSVKTQNGSDKLTFINVTDSQSQSLEQYTDSWANVINKAFELYPETDFIFHTGDTVDNPKNINQWQWLFNTPSQHIMSTYFMPVSGNHEEFADNAITDKFVISDYPEQDTATGVYYSFDYNNAHFIILNSNNLNDEEGLSDEQLEWLKNDAASSDAQWKILGIHKAAYSNGSHYKDDDVCAIRDQLSVLMPELDIDIVFQGHDHVYMRTYALDNNLVTDTQRVYLSHNGKKYPTDVMPTGTSYVIAGSSGVKLYNQNDLSLTDQYFPRAEKIITVDSSVFSSVEINGGVLYFDAYTVTGNNAVCIDSFAIQKDINDGEYAGDCEDVSAEKQNAKEENFIEKMIAFFKKIFTVIMNIFKMYF